MALATTNFEVGLVQLAIQNGSVFSSQRPVAPTFSMLLGKDAEMQDNIIANVKGVPTYGALSDAEIRSGIIRSFLGYQTTLGGSVTRANQTATISTFTPQEVLTDLALRTTYYQDGGQFINVARVVEGQGAGWAANMSYEEVFAAQMVQEYIRRRSEGLFVNAATGLVVAPLGQSFQWQACYSTPALSRAIAPAPALPPNAAVSSCVNFLRCFAASTEPASPKTSASAVVCVYGDCL